MKKKKNIIDKFINLINNRYKNLERDFDKAGVLTQELKLISKVIDDEEQEEFTALSSLSSEEFQEIVMILEKDKDEDEKNIVRAAHYLSSNGVTLLESQTEKLRELVLLASIKKSKLEKTIQRNEEKLSDFDSYGKLEEKLSEIREKGFLDSDTIKILFDKLGIKEDEQSQLLDGILLFNQNRFASLVTIERKANEKIEILDIPIEIIGQDEVLSIYELQIVLEKHNYDISILDDELLQLVLQEGKLDKIDSILESIERNHLDFIKNDAQSAPLLVRFLLESSSKIIDDKCKKFKDAAVGKEYLQAYVLVFFEQQDKDASIDQQVQKKAKLPSSGPSQSSSHSSRVAGKSQDFEKNLELLESLGHDRKILLERNVKTLLSPHITILGNLKKLRLYEFSIDDNPHFPLSTLFASKIMDRIDSYIELGLEKYILDNPSNLASYANGRIERVYALKQKGYPYMTTHNGKQRMLRHACDLTLPCGLSDEMIDEIVPKDAYGVLKGNRLGELLEEYIPISITEETLNNPIVKEMDERYKVTNLSYNFNGVTISRKKFLRNYEFLMSTDLISAEDKDTEKILLVSAIHNSMLNMDEIEKVNNSLNGCITVGGKNGILKK